MTTEEREYDAGFWLPDVDDEDNVTRLRVWNGEWASLATFKFVRIKRDGGKVESSFPPKGES